MTCFYADFQNLYEILIVGLVTIALQIAIH